MAEVERLNRDEVREFMSTRSPQKDASLSRELFGPVYVGEDGSVLVCLENGKGVLYRNLEVLRKIAGETSTVGRPPSVLNSIGGSPDAFFSLVEQSPQILSSSIGTDSSSLDFTMESLSLFDDYLRSVDCNAFARSKSGSALVAYTSEAIRRYVSGAYDCVPIPGASVVEPWLVCTNHARLAVFLWVAKHLDEPKRHARFAESMSIYLGVEYHPDRDQSESRSPISLVATVRDPEANSAPAKPEG